MSELREKLEKVEKYIWDKFQELTKDNPDLIFIQTFEDLDNDEYYFEFRNKHEENIRIHVLSLNSKEFKVMDTDDQDFGKTFELDFLDFNIFDRITLIEMIEEKLAESK